MADITSQLDDIFEVAGLRSCRCLRCDVCCRFPSPITRSAPFFTREEMRGLSELDEADLPFLLPGYVAGEKALLLSADGIYLCPYFRPESNDCSIYAHRPLDCRLYPLILMFDELGERVWLAADEVCPFVAEMWDAPAWREMVTKVTMLLEGSLAERIARAPGLITTWQEQARPIQMLDELTRRVCRSDLGLARLVATSVKGLAPYFSARPSCLTGRTFPGMYLWADHFNLFWRVTGSSLLLFAESDGLAFLLAPPLGEGEVLQSLKVAGETLAALSRPGSDPWLQQADEKLLPVLTAAGWRITDQEREYIYHTRELADLRGRRYESQRHAYNQFVRQHPAAIFRPYQSSDFPHSVKLLQRWQKERAARHAEEFYRHQLLDSGFVHLRALREAEELGLTGRVVLVEDRLVAYTFGFPASDGETFIVFLEVADLEFPGLAEFIYRRFCGEHLNYRFINAGSDSGLPNLARVKEAYHPCRVVTSYVLTPPKDDG